MVLYCIIPFGFIQPRPYTKLLVSVSARKQPSAGFRPDSEVVQRVEIAGSPVKRAFRGVPTDFPPRRPRIPCGKYQLSWRILPLTLALSDAERIVPHSILIFSFPCFTSQNAQSVVLQRFRRGCPLMFLVFLTTPPVRQGEEHMSARARTPCRRHCSREPQAALRRP